MRILLIEDEVPLTQALEKTLKKYNYTIDIVHNGEDGLDYGLTNIYDIIITDIMIPKLNGIDLVKELRAQEIKAPILMLTAKSTIADKIQGLDIGADDYISKPFETQELLARIRALSRRINNYAHENIIIYKDISLNKNNAEISVGKNLFKLTLKESQVMAMLIQNKHTTVTKEKLIEKIWGVDSLAEDNHVEVYISFLRKKLLKLGTKVKIKTTRGIGYSLE